MGMALWEHVKDLNTAATQDWDATTLVRCDPYLVWADAATREPQPEPQAEPETGLQAELQNVLQNELQIGAHIQLQEGAKKPKWEDRLDIAVLVELNAAADYGEFLERMNEGAANVDELRFVPNGFEPNGSQARYESRFITGLVNRQGLAALVGDVVKGEIDRFALQDSRWGIGQFAQAEWKKYHVTEAPAATAEAVPPASPQAVKSSAGTYLGIIDDGLPVFRVRESIQFADQPAHFWDQGWQAPESMASAVGLPSPDDPYWRIAWKFLVKTIPPTKRDKPRYEFRARGFLYGRRLESLSNSTGARGPLARLAVSCDQGDYTRVRYFHPAPRRSHGAGVLGLLAPWLSDARHRVVWPDHVSGLSLVQLPSRTVKDTSGGSLAMRVIDGLRFILWQEEDDRPDGLPPRPIVANISYGVHAGPHDGTSMFEEALREMLDANDHLHVVLPAGNAARAGCHARRELMPMGGTGDAASFMLNVLPDNSRDTFVELWLPEGARVSLAIRPPGSDAVYRVVEGEARLCFEPSPTDPATPHTVHFGAVYPARVAQGRQGTMLLLAIGSTQRWRAEPGFARGLNQRRRREVAGSSGLWALEVRNLTADAFAVDAWVERGDAPPDAAEGSRQAYFPDSCDERGRRHNSTPENTLNGIATLQHARLHVVGAMRADGVLSDYSAAGPARAPGHRQRPDEVAPADASRNLPGLRTIGFVHGATGRINGTSAACAVFARALAKQLAPGPAIPAAPQPDDVPPEVSCVTDSQPEAPAELRGRAVRKLFPFEVDL